jgi:hypothetical protein
MRYVTALSMVILVMGLLSCEKKETIKEPVAQFNVSPEKGSFNTIFTFDANMSYDESDEDGQLQARWDWEGDGIFDTDYSSVLVKNHRYSEPSQFNPVVQVRNRHGWSDTETSTVYVFPDSVPPVADFIACPDTAIVNSLINFNSAISFDPYTDIGEMRFRWDWESDGLWDTPYTCDTCIHHKFEEEGAMRVTLEAMNKYAFTDTTSHVIYVYDVK